jgi:chromosome segregation ATPase
MTTDTVQESQTVINARITAIQNQRNFAFDQSVIMAGLIADRDEQISNLHAALKAAQDYLVQQQEELARLTAEIETLRTRLIAASNPPSPAASAPATVPVATSSLSEAPSTDQSGTQS